MYMNCPFSFYFFAPLSLVCMHGCMYVFMHYYPLYACMHLLPCLSFYPFYFSPNPLFVYYPLHPCMYACLLACLLVFMHACMYAYRDALYSFTLYHLFHLHPHQSYIHILLILILILTNFHCPTLLYPTLLYMYMYMYSKSTPLLHLPLVSSSMHLTSIVHQFHLVFQFLFSLVGPCVLLIPSLHPIPSSCLASSLSMCACTVTIPLCFFPV
jgi:hypothetical protein